MTTFKRLMITASVIASGASAWAEPVEDYYFNYRKAPENLEDLKAIQSALQTHLERARAATVSIDLGEGFGSGVIISEDGLVMTAAHVSGGVDKELTIILNDGTRLAAKSLGLVSTTDSALVKITEEGKYPFVNYDKDDRTRLGHWVFALGHSGGFDQERGPVLRLGRVVGFSDTTLQTDCKVIGGDSGGPLFDLNGQVVAINSRVQMTMEQNMHVPVRDFIRNWDELMAGEFIGDGPFAQRPERGNGFVGVLTEDSDAGIRVVQLETDGPAERAGVEVGDIIVKLADIEVANKDELRAVLAELSAKDEVKLVVERNGEILQLEFELDVR